MISKTELRIGNLIRRLWKGRQYNRESMNPDNNTPDYIQAAVRLRDYMLSDSKFVMERDDRIFNCIVAGKEVGYIRFKHAFGGYSFFAEGMDRVTVSSVEQLNELISSSGRH